MIKKNTRVKGYNVICSLSIWKYIIISISIIGLLGICLGCGNTVEEPVQKEDNSALFENTKNDEKEKGNYVGTKLKDFYKQTGENYISVSGDIIRTQIHKIKIDRTNGNDMNECEIISVEEILRYKQYEGITYKEYVHLTDDREIVRIIYLQNKEKSAYVETGNGILLYFAEGVPNGIKPDKNTDKLFDLFITECTN